MTKQRLVLWYSHGAASLMAAKIAADTYKGDREVLFVNIYIEDELHEPELEAWAEAYVGIPMTTIRDSKYGASVDKVIEKRRYMSGTRGAPCTTELKKQVRRDWQRPDDLHVFGMDVKEEYRIDQILDGEPTLDIWAPLIDNKLTKADCFTELSKQPGYTLPKMYQLGFHNNNCKGCVKAVGAGYWNNTRKHLPDVFHKRARQEELLGVALCRLSKKDTNKYGEQVIAQMRADGVKPKNITADGRLRVPLRYLPKDAGTLKDLDIGDCGFFCEVKE